jgi:hypothetical protein
VGHVLSGSGRPLDPSLGRDSERHFGRDFCEVRVHTGAVASQSAQDVGADAYTVGQEPCAENNQHFDWHIPVAGKPDL